MTTLTNNRTLVTTAFLGILMAGSLPSIAVADGWELRTSVDEVPGTRQLEKGELDKAERISEWAVESVSIRDKGKVLNNLCIIHTLKRDYEEAGPYCEEAVKRGGGNVAYNNRGVLRSLQGDLQGAMDDFQVAAKLACGDGCDPNDADGRDTPTHVALRNLGRAQTKYAAIIEREAGTVQTAQTDQ